MRMRRLEESVDFVLVSCRTDANEYSSVPFLRLGSYRMNSGARRVSDGGSKRDCADRGREEIADLSLAAGSPHGATCTAQSSE